MQYTNIREARFLCRPNRFIAHIEIDGRQEICHVKNTGRCRELLLPGAPILVQAAVPGKRKTPYDLIGVHKGDRLINIDSQAPNKVFHEWVLGSGYFPSLQAIQPEYRYHSSRFDFCLEAAGGRILVEVKGVTLEEDGVALFPDAPTERGLRHINELCRARQEGFEAYLVFIIQMKDVRYFAPNHQTHPAFGAALSRAARQGVNIIALDCEVSADSITARDFVPCRQG